MIVRLHEVRGPSEADDAAKQHSDDENMSSFENALRRDLAAPSRTIAFDRHLGGWRKRALDVVGAAAGLAVLAPALGVIALVIKIQDRGPVFFGHNRIGYGGEVFRCWKFRTMQMDAEQRLNELLASDVQAALEWSATRKLKNDPRVTKFGDLLRRTSLDELPQLWNVLVGEMSLVGPRPVTQEEIDQMKTGKKQYLSARPGLSGLWQISGRSDTSRDDRQMLDKNYVKNWSLISDVKIILRTIPAVLARRGAY